MFKQSKRALTTHCLSKWGFRLVGELCQIEEIFLIIAHYFFEKMISLKFSRPIFMSFNNYFRVSMKPNARPYEDGRPEEFLFYFIKNIYI